MHLRFEQQISLRTTAISDVQFPLKSLDELLPILMALQYIFITPELNEKVFELLEKKVCGGKKKTGRKGMDLWHILVLAVVRNGRGSNWNSLALDANHHTLVRKIMGVHGTEFLGEEGEQFTYQNIVDNVKLIDEPLLQQINQLVVDAEHKLVKKKEAELLSLKTDSYALETNVHFPTDLNLLWDSLRKCLDMIEKLKELTSLQGWRKIKNIRKMLKSLFLSQHTEKICKVLKQKNTYFLHNSRQKSCLKIA